MCLTSPESLGLSSNIEEDGRWFACPGEHVTFTCEVNQSKIVQIAAGNFSSLRDPISFLASDAVGSPIRATPTDPFQANLTYVQQDANQTLANFIVTLTTNTSNETDNTVVICAGLSTVQRKKITMSGGPK